MQSPLACRVTSNEFRAARAALGLSADKMARLLRVQSGRTVRRWEAGQDIPGPVAVILEAMATCPEFCALLLNPVA